MARTTAELVEGVIELDELIEDITPFINAANTIVTRLCAAALNADGVPYYTEGDELTQIETWLAAHFYGQRDPRIDTEKAGPVSQRFQYKIDLYLDNTHYGQMAIALDTSGALARFNRQLKKGTLGLRVGVMWVGKKPNELVIRDPDVWVFVV